MLKIIFIIIFTNSYIIPTFHFDSRRMLDQIEYIVARIEEKLNPVV